MKIELLYFDDCPSWQECLANLELALDVEGIPGQIELVRIESDQEANERKFLGSPSIQVDGRDLWNEERPGYDMSCRIYATPEGMRGSPTVESIQAKLRQVIKQK